MMPFERILKTMLTPWVAIVYLSVVGVSFLFLDQSIALYFHEVVSHPMSVALGWLTALGKNVLYIGLFFALALFFRYVRPRRHVEVASVF